MSLGLELSLRLASHDPWGQAASAFPALGFETPDSCRGPGHLNSGPSVCTTSTSPTQPSPTPGSSSHSELQARFSTQRPLGSCCLLSSLTWLSMNRDKKWNQKLEGCLPYTWTMALPRTRSLTQHQKLFFVFIFISFIMGKEAHTPAKACLMEVERQLAGVNFLLPLCGLGH